MQDTLKQRLIGALILVALGVVFWPIIFIEPGQRTSFVEERIPRAPGVDTRSVEVPDSVGLRPSRPLQSVVEDYLPMTPDGTAPDTPMDDSETPTTQAGASPALDRDGLPIAWSLQVASVSSEEKANELHRRLLELKHKAYIKNVRRDGRDLFRVCIGPKFTRSKLEALQAEIDTEFGVQSLLLRYLP